MNQDKFTINQIEGIVVLRKSGKAVEPDKVVTTLEEALKGVIIEWEN